MESLQDKIVLITGASSGIGRASAMAFASIGARLILTARRIDRLQVLAAQLRERHGTKSLTLGQDVRDRSAVESAFSSLPQEWEAIEALVNNAGLSRGLDKLYEGSVDDWEEMIDTNLKGLLYVSRAVIPGMVKRNSGTIVNIGSIAGHEVYPNGNVYCATKFAVDAITTGLRLELVDTAIRVCTVNPGLVETNFSLVRFHGDEERAKKVYENITPLTPDDVADAVLYCATRPPHVQIADIIMLATHQGSTTIYHRSPSS